MKPAHHPRYIGPAVAGRQGGPVDHQGSKAELARGNQLGLGPAAAGVFGDNQRDPVAVQQLQIIGGQKRAARDLNTVLRQGEWVGWRIDEAQEIMVLRLAGEIAQVLPPDGKEDPLRRATQSLNRSRNIGQVLPVIAGASRPGRPLQRQKRRAGDCAGGKRIAADLRGKGMGGVDHRRDLVIAEKCGQPVRPAKAADALRDRLGARGLGPARIGEQRRPAHGGHRLGQLAGLGRAAEDEELLHG